jgi:hypothetical protein
MIPSERLRCLQGLKAGLQVLIPLNDPQRALPRQASSSSLLLHSKVRSLINGCSWAFSCARVAPYRARGCMGPWPTGALVMGYCPAGFPGRYRRLVRPAPDH